MAKAGDTIFSLGAITIDEEGVCRVRADVGLLGNNGARHRLRPQMVVVPLTEAQAAQVASLRAAIAATIQASPPPDLAGAAAVPALTREEQRAARTADREAARAATRPR
jgi:hypothetical protein